jgi:cell division protein FtsZ
MRPTEQAQRQPEPELGQAEDDLEIPSFLRRLAN